MKYKVLFKQLPESFLFFILLPGTILFSCENHGFDRDKRQIRAKDEIQGKLRNARSFDINAFKEDTVIITSNPDFEKAIRYTLDIEYVDSNQVLQKKKGIVLFTPDGKSIIRSEISEN